MTTPSRIEVLNEGNFEGIVKGNSFAIIDCWAPWCAPCRMIAPIMEELATKYSEVTFGKLNVDENVGIAGRFEIMAIPTILFFRRGELVDKIVGAVPMSVIEEKIDALHR